MVPFDDPGLFNATVDRFFRMPFVKKDRVKDASQVLPGHAGFGTIIGYFPINLLANINY
jgi:hypothetical protein